MQYYILVAVAIWSAVFVDSRNIRGISLAYRKFYKEKKTFLCLDGSKIIPFDQVNDDYCDCLDGSDEPGTAACLNGRFYCTNRGFRPSYIQSSRVNDGICDCCDGYDEHDNRTRCPNTCRNLGQQERAALEAEMRAVDDGMRLKRQLIKEGVSMWQEKQNQLKDLRRILSGLQTKLDAHRERKLEADAHQAKVMGVLKSPEDGAGGEIAARIFGQLDINKDGSLTVDEVQAGVVNLQDDGNLTEEEVTIKADLTGDLDPPDEGPGTSAASSAARHGEADLKEMEEALETTRAEIRDLEKVLSTDYGSSKEFLYLQGQCFQLVVYEYTYSLCPFSHVTQKSSTGAEVSLGKWQYWAGPPEQPYSRMEFEGGVPCWQGPLRTTLVTLTCGTETALRWVREPAKCRYVMELRTPSACEQRREAGRRGVHSEL
ncbi:glucosidase 2 subunit beta-like isoform X2 [Brienomyrus brachyistius]|uniref:glucosidase 2 subunit beta-like isoform X2 n=1 Tax=Brienomyrus brachyistius TaxID=42636 RepID=UPI0020B32F44|nr:glucosidase 2 subunit beta-like isoform X2 [Brienomyrus brachyistius]